MHTTAQRERERERERDPALADVRLYTYTHTHTLAHTHTGVLSEQCFADNDEEKLQFQRTIREDMTIPCVVIDVKYEEFAVGMHISIKKQTQIQHTHTHTHTHTHDYSLRRH